MTIGLVSMLRYTDLSGDNIDRPEGFPVEWRVSCYPVVQRNGRILMVEPVWAARWELPGGGVELATEETLIEATIRECMEETGYTLLPEPESLRLVSDVFFSVAKEERYYHSLLFSVLGKVGAEPDPRWTPIADEIRKIEWIDDAIWWKNGSIANTGNRSRATESFKDRLPNPDRVHHPERLCHSDSLVTSTKEECWRCGIPVSA
jgi:8-oxo-dGTP pyrophosphatase MutT (NUDIX family)